MSAQQPVSSSRGQRSMTIGSAAGSGPLPGVVAAAREHAHDHDVRRAGAPAAAQRVPDRGPHALGGQLRAVEHQPAVHARSAARSSAAAAAMPASAARCARRIPASSLPFFARRRADELLVVHDELDAVGAQPVGDRDAGAPAAPAPPSGPRGRRSARRPRARPRRRGIPPSTSSKRPELVDAEELRLRPHRRDPLALERVREDHGAPVRLEVRERVDDHERDLVAQRGDRSRCRRAARTLSRRLQDPPGPRRWPARCHGNAPRAGRTSRAATMLCSRSSMNTQASAGSPSRASVSS